METLQKIIRKQHINTIKKLLDYNYKELDIINLVTEDLKDEIKSLKDEIKSLKKELKKAEDKAELKKTITNNKKKIKAKEVTIKEDVKYINDLFLTFKN